FDKVLTAVTSWHPPLCFRKVDEGGARQAVLRQRPVLTTFRLSAPGWERFSNHFRTVRRSILTHQDMSPYSSLPGAGSHVDVLISCDSRSLKFLNSWGHDWGDHGCFRVEDYAVLELDEASGESIVCFYDVYNAAYDLTAEE
ncbi:hypothetical protein K432DRAFT_260430, partial [Lepidopterella palustris CBS 459.81]